LSGPEPARPGRASAILRVVLAFGLLGLVIALNRDQVRSVLHRRPDGALFALGFGLYLSGLMLAFLRWYLLVRVLAMPFRVRDALRLGFIGTLFNLVIPGAVGGDVVKAAYLCREQERKAQAVATIVVDRILGLLGLFGLAGVAGLLYWGTLDLGAKRLVVIVWVLIGVGLALLAVATSPAVHRRPARSARKEKRRAELAEAAAAYRGHPGALTLALWMATATHGLNVLAFFAADAALFRPVPTLAEHCVIVPLVLFSTAVPLPLAALGLSEGVSASLFRLAHFDGGAVAMMGFRVLQYAGAILAAFVYLPNRGRVRTLIREADIPEIEPVPGPTV